MVTVHAFFVLDQFRGFSGSSSEKETTIGSARAFWDMALESSSGGVDSRRETVERFFSMSFSAPSPSVTESCSSDTNGRLGSSKPVTSSG
jgi:hypothetical protein